MPGVQLTRFPKQLPPVGGCIFSPLVWMPMVFSHHRMSSALLPCLSPSSCLTRPWFPRGMYSTQACEPPQPDNSTKKHNQIHRVKSYLFHLTLKGKGLLLTLIPRTILDTSKDAPPMLPVKRMSDECRWHVFHFYAHVARMQGRGSELYCIVFGEQANIWRSIYRKPHCK